METATAGVAGWARAEALAIAWFDRATALDDLADDLAGRLDDVERRWTPEVFEGGAARRGHAALLDQQLSLAHAVLDLRDDADRARALGAACRREADALRATAA